MKVLLVTGGAGFIGSNFINYFLRRNKSYVIVNYDNLTYSGNMNNLREIERSPRYHFVKGSICNQDLVNYIIKRHRPDYIINFASETCPKKSLINPAPFFETNVMGTLTLLDSARYFWGKNNFEGNRFIQVSTDEVYGPVNAKDTYFTEDSAVMPENPYSASKASADLLVKSFSNNYGFPAVISRCCNNYGPNQHIDKFVPSCIKNSILNNPVRLNEDANNIRREWIHVLDHCTALIRILFYGRDGETYNISSGIAASDVELAKKILKTLGKSEDQFETTGTSERQELQYAVNSYKIRNNLNWGHKYNLDDGILETVRWYKENRDWWDKNPD
ncbi:dTDP-glucose 4,6-dehydratase [Acetivibrio cellulolyticus]|uniref:dTDP-glucose 4,6-dehydratase n=1 Tax=Acetivibrio cellulolyticus TaxID=35830 RepID=UPI0001E2E2C8|nr:GDP-mannose 4,6-dehydratase [Acetivibrio cellulolyticus]